jgi:hypothetical protein
MVRRMSDGGHVKRSVKIPDVFLHDTKPLIPSTAASNAPVLSYLTVEAYKRQREHEVRENKAPVEAKEKSQIQNGQVTSTTSSQSSQPQNFSSSANSQQKPVFNATQPETHHNESSHYAARKCKSKQIPRSDRKDTSASPPNETEGMMPVQQPRSVITENKVPPTPTRIKTSPQPGEVYINAQGKRVRLVKKVRPRTAKSGVDEDPKPKARPKQKPRNTSQRRQDIPNKHGKSIGASSNRPNSTGLKKRRRKPRTKSLSHSDYPTSIDIPTDYEERSVQSELNMLSLGDLTPIEIAKMEPPSQAFNATVPCTPASRDSKTTGQTMSSSSSVPAFGRKTVTGNKEKNIITASAVCGCVIS